MEKEQTKNASTSTQTVKKRTVETKTVNETENLILNLLSDEDLSIVRIVKSKGKYSLQSSIWALGIVTGDNKKSCPQNALMVWKKYIPEKKSDLIFYYLLKITFYMTGLNYSKLQKKKFTARLKNWCISLYQKTGFCL